jgi:alkanesulfonate monooxygenase SsuD/methylene tetrahydromethanopterin reductase-like flavin-dependent oxidoreductase (luciferase family)
MFQIIKGLASGEPLTFQGRHFDLDSVVMKPQPVQLKGVPILLACHWRAQARDKQVQRAARWADGLISVSDTPDEYGQVVQQVRATAGELGRDPGDLEAVMYLTVNLDQDRARASQEAEQWLMGYYGANIWGTRWGPFGDAARVKDRLAEYADAGAQTLVVRFASFHPERQLDIFLDKVAPAFQC